MFKPLIMVVDDEKDLADDVAELIRSTGKYDTTVVYSAKEALSKIDQHNWLLGIPKNRISCIILDIKMPEMDGMQFLNKLWKIREEQYPPGSELSQGRDYIPVIILSAWEDKEKWTNTPRKLEYLRKPVNEEELFAALERVMKGRAEYSKMWGEVEQKGKERGFLE